MNRGTLCGAALAGALMALAPLPSAAQMYRCSNGSTTYLSDRPCGGGPAVSLSGNGQKSAPTGSTRLGAIGPAPTPAMRSSPTAYPPMAKAGEHLQYMSPACAEMSEGIRTGPARGLRGAALTELHENYRRQCSEDEQQARQRLWQKVGDERAQRRASDQAVRDERRRETLTAEQCHEMLRILSGRRQRAATMNAGEKADLDLFEANYRARCARA